MKGVVRSISNGMACVRHGKSILDCKWVQAGNLKVGDKGKLEFVKTASAAIWVFKKD